MGALKNISNIFKYGFYLVFISAILGVGVYIGRKTVKVPKPITIIEYRDSEPIHDTIDKPVPVPYKVDVPADTFDVFKKIIAEGLYQELWPKEQQFETKEDSTEAIVKDWATKRYYKEEIFNVDSLGRATVDAEVQYNRLKFTGYEFTPKVKTIEHTIYTVKKWSPFVSAGAMFGVGNENPEKIGDLGVGVFYNERFGAELKYQRGFVSKTDYVGGSVLFKF